ncbi:MAG: CHAD domain-containing protein [Chloroflexota bacterium]
MPYRLKPRESIPNGIQRILTEQVERALAQLRGITTTREEGTQAAREQNDERIHDARKRFKKARAVLRLVRDEIGETVYHQENVAYRDAGRALAPMRDSAVMLETLDGLTDHYADSLGPHAFDSIRGYLLDIQQAVREQILDGDTVARVIDNVDAARGRIAALPVSDTTFGAFYDGLKRVYKRGCKAMADAYDDPTTEHFHEWRKRVKYLWYHTRLLRVSWPDVLDPAADAIQDLSDDLGDDHDLAELRERVTRRPIIDADLETRQALIGLIDRRRLTFRARARPRGLRIYAEKPKVFVKRMARYWEASRQTIRLRTDERPVVQRQALDGTLADG